MTGEFQVVHSMVLLACNFFSQLICIYAGHIIFEELEQEKNNLPKDTNLTSILQGSPTYFVAIFAGDKLTVVELTLT